MRISSLCAAVSCTLALTSSAVAATLAIHAGTLLDGVNNVPQHNVTVLVQDDRIVAVTAGFATPPDAEVLDLSGSTVTPGFIDCHVHMSLLLPAEADATEYAMTHSDIDRAFDGARFARAMLQQGFTSARDLGGGDETVALRKAIAQGKIPGPRLWVSLEPLSPSGGHWDRKNGLDPKISNPEWQNGIVDSAMEARYRVREHKRRGADLIKLMVSGGIGSTGDNPQLQLMAEDEIRAAVETAHSLGMKVAAHDYPADAIESAVRAGVDSIEHGSFATAQTFTTMKARGTYLVPTLTVFDIYYAAARDHPERLAPGTAPKELANDLLPKKNLALAVKSGVKIALGSDIGEGDHSLEFQLLIENGMTPEAALLAATRNAADLLGAADRIGSIQPGRFADLVAMDGDPLANPALFRQVSFVMKGGVVYRRDGHPTTPSQ